MVLFLLTLGSCWFTYGWFWGGGDVTADPALAWDAAQYAGALMLILLSHEMGHWVVARRHGLDQSLPQFIPFPLAFGTLGAIIRLRTLPRTRTALLEVGAAGPLAGFVVAVIVMAVGLPGTVEHAVPRIVTAWPLPPPEAPGPVGEALAGGLAWLDQALAPVLALLGSDIEPGGPVEIPLLVLANPKLMDALGWVVLGAPPGRYADIPPLVLAAWAGCFVTAMNLLPIGQLDGGHVFNALLPAQARRLSKIGLGVLAVGGLLWGGWLMWAILLGVLGAWRSVPVPAEPGLSSRARSLAALALVAFLACFMPTPIEDERWAVTDLQLETPEGQPIPPSAYLRAIEARRPEAAGAGEGTPPAQPDGAAPEVAEPDQGG